MSSPDREPSRRLATPSIESLDRCKQAGIAPYWLFSVVYDMRAWGRYDEPLCGDDATDTVLVCGRCWVSLKDLRGLPVGTATGWHAQRREGLPTAYLCPNCVLLDAQQHLADDAVARATPTEPPVGGA